MRKVIIWGIGDDYEMIHNQLQFEKRKENIEIVAFVARKEDIYMSSLDGCDVITKEELSKYEYDYLVVASQQYFNEIRKEAIELGVDEKIIINGMVFLTYNFDFQRYINLIENPITILSDDCWGGLVYKALYLPANTPTINVWFPKEDFLKLVQDIPYYMNASVHLLQEGDLKNSKYPIGLIGDGDKKIKIMFAHERTFEEGMRNWNRRKDRINYENIFVKMAMNGDEVDAEQKLEKFARIPYKKVCFYPGDTAIKEVQYLKRFEVHNIIGKNRNLIDKIKFDAYCRDYKQLVRSIDVLKLLNGDSDYMREK